MKALIICGCALLAACSGEPVSRDAGQAQLAIISGELSPESDDGVLALRTDRTKDTSVCSASLVAPNVVLTARHCLVAEYPADDIRCNSDGTLMMPSGGQLGVAVAPERVSVFAGAHPESDGNSGLPGGEPAAIGLHIVTGDWPSVCRDDVGLVILDRALSLPIVPLDLTRVVAKGERVSLVGFGLTETSNPGDRWTPRRRRDGVTIRYVGTLPNTFVLGPSVCMGDSGGPALDADSGAIVGVYSLGFPGNDPSACSASTALNYFVQVRPYEGLLRQAFQLAGQPFPELPGGDGGAGGNGGELEPSASGGQPDQDAGGANGGVSSEGETAAGAASASNSGAGTGAGSNGAHAAGGGCAFSPRQAGGSPLLVLAGCLAILVRRRRRAEQSGTRAEDL